MTQFEFISDSDLTWSLFAELVAASPRALRNAVDDAHLAGIAISRGATLASFDSDFECFVEHGLRWDDLARS
jgi:predicted nucleic acid-binding protein